jgi:signal transduction histidine kinase
MAGLPKEPVPAEDRLRRLLPYVAALELEVDRLRRHNQHVHHETLEALGRVGQLCAGAEGAGAREALAPVARAVAELRELLLELRGLPGYHPAHDQVVALAVRPLAEKLFRQQQRLAGAPEVLLRLDLESESVEWFPARLLHVLDNLIANSIKFRDPAKAESWVHLGLRVSAEGYEFRVSDNGVGLPAGERDLVLELFYRSAPARAAGLGVGLAAVKLLVEQSGGALTVESREGQGSTFVVFLPRYDLEDYLL